MTRYAGVFIVGVVLAAVVAIVGAFFMVDVTSEVAIRLQDVPGGVSYRRVGRSPVFLVRDTDHVDVFIALSTHLREPLHWCVRERMFYEPRVGGDWWDLEGRKLPGAPAPLELNRFSVRIDGSDLLVDTGQVIPGAFVGDVGTRGIPTPEWLATPPMQRCQEALPPLT